MVRRPVGQSVVVSDQPLTQVYLSGKKGQCALTKLLMSPELSSVESIVELYSLRGYEVSIRGLIRGVSIYVQFA